MEKQPFVFWHRRGGNVMKIAMLTNNYKPFVGGVPISVERLAKEFEETGTQGDGLRTGLWIDPRYGRWKRTMSSGFR